MMHVCCTTWDFAADDAGDDAGAVVTRLVEVGVHAAAGVDPTTADTRGLAHVLVGTAPP